MAARHPRGAGPAARPFDRSGARRGKGLLDPYVRGDSIVILEEPVPGTACGPPGKPLERIPVR